MRVLLDEDTPVQLVIPLCHVLLTNDRSQLNDPVLCDAIKKSGLHHVRYDQSPGITGLALTLAAIIAAMPKVIDDLKSASSQRLVRIRKLERATRRHETVDPTKNPPSPYWPR